MNVERTITGLVVTLFATIYFSLIKHFLGFEATVIGGLAALVGVVASQGESKSHE